MDYGRIIEKSNGTRILIHEQTKDKHYYVENHIIWLIHMDMYLERLAASVQEFYTLCYRPNEDDQTLLAFCVLIPKKATPEKVEDELQEWLPNAGVPEVVSVKEIPRLPGSTQVDENALLKLYKEMRKKSKSLLF